MRRRRTAPMFAIYSAGQTNQENSCVAVMEGLRTPSKDYCRKAHRGDRFNKEVRVITSRIC
jgi:hypothetical protein